MAEETIELPSDLDLSTAKDVLREFATTDDAQIVSADTLSQKDDKIDELAGVYRDALQKQKGLSEAAVNGMTIDALTAEFRNDDGDLEADTLAQEPEAAVPSGGSDTDTLSGASITDDVKDKLRRADLLADRTPDHADTLRQEAAEAAGVDDWETLESEVEY